ncbi:hypothetical protein HJC23_002278 [Cyclotella cryptica]|uniref:Uncharacterized protein n=1 Tax=Cyclotella cryptica TaxID=29204 RepID=A0ABD3QFY1_9STRA|eukprot:CCRYP_005752-RA/>CCRYP_005752-RA protein AED:0.36 eAED:0.36 QI:0/-1/0/1/-1/1/1/0/114
MSSTALTPNNATTNAPPPTMSLTARFLVFLCIPLLFGVAGLGASYLQTKSVPYHEIDFNRDFVVPCVLVMALVVVIGFRTGGFRGQGEVVGVGGQEEEDVKDGDRKGKRQKKKQ